MTEARQLHIDGIITTEELEQIAHYESYRLFSIHWELRTILYGGILLFTSGVAVVIYKHIDTIGHQSLLVLLAVAIGACFYYLIKHRQPYSHGVVKNVSHFFDYIALLACLLSATFVGYLQYQYYPFGNQLWLATLLPSLLFLYCAYAFDHKGLLALGITGFAGTLGLSLAPAQLLNDDKFTDSTLLFTALAFGLALILIALYSDRKKIKRHFGFSYHHFAATLLFIACLALLFNYPYKLWSILLLAALCIYFTRYAIRQQSFLFLLYAVVYTYAGLTYIVFSVLMGDVYNQSIFMLGMLYVIASCVGVILFFIKYKKILRLS